MESSSLHHRDVRRIREIVLSWGKKNYQEYPWRDPDRKWHGLAAEILLQRTRAQNVVPVYAEFVDRFPEPEDLGRATEEEILDVIGSLGLHWRAPLLKKLGQELTGKESIPHTLDGLKELPGVGTYVGSAWLTFHAEKRSVLVDSNIVRWICRLLGREYDGETRREGWVRNLLDRLTPEDQHQTFNYALLDFTMNVCQPTRPLCEECPIGAEFCEHGRERLASD
ncbi:hypothetical protein [Salinibacter ruber]|uniref:hypothetical protein n=1 Tax=Salinibacter ruber TaxID=146919 RepID=UPI00216A0AB6|nr:hypothetical protein [Salinibacter ruber]MCS3613392.1 A/G-specific adenine glycosylase [Salinibacter ruber]